MKKGSLLVIEEPRESSSAHEGNGFELLDRGIHGVEAIGVKLEGVERLDAGDEEHEPAGEVALPVLVFPACLRLAQSVVFPPQRGLAPAKDADRALAGIVHRHWRIAFAVAHPPIR